VWTLSLLLGKLAPTGETNPGPPTLAAQARLRFPHLQVKLKQQLLRSKDGNGNCSCRDSDIEFPVFNLSIHQVTPTTPN
jgi:hypothetical protein